MRSAVGPRKRTHKPSCRDRGNSGRTYPDGPFIDLEEKGAQIVAPGYNARAHLAAHATNLEQVVGEAHATDYAVVMGMQPAAASVVESIDEWLLDHADADGIVKMGERQLKLPGTRYRARAPL